MATRWKRWVLGAIVFLGVICWPLASNLTLSAQEEATDEASKRQLFLPLVSSEGGANPTPDQPKPAPRSALTMTNQLIIHYAEEVIAAGSDRTEQVNALSEAAGTPLSYVRRMENNAIVVQLAEWQPVEAVSALANQLLSVPEVAAAEPDLLMQIMRTPNDPAYSDQWHYFAPAPGNYGINLPAAWDLTTGSTNVVVAVIDTGVLLNHTDLAGRMVPGYDFISDVFNANDGNGRDADANDPGDWLTWEEAFFGPCAGGSATDSSWHGTHVAGTIAANSNNSLGVAGINWQAKILPVRVLGKCGGYLSDIADSIRWSAGLPVTGVPANQNPAKVINMSLGGQAACGTAYQNAINAAVAAGSVVVVAAGNSNANAANFTPANCNNVITVAATDRYGDRAYYSNYGTVVEVAAPGGETNLFGSDGVLSTLNLGTMGPTTDAYVYYQGTSMAAPHVAGVASLLFAVNPNLTPAQVTTLLQNNVTPFPLGSSCTTSLCGAGIVNTAAAVRAAQGTVNNPPGAFAKNSPSNGSTVATGNVTLGWGASAQVGSYEYCVDSVNNNSCDSAWVTTNTATSATLSNLVAGTNYYWQVRAVNGAGATPADNGAWWSFTMQQSSGLPGAFVKTSPGNQVTNVARTTVLRWERSNGATRYEVCGDTVNNNRCDGLWVNVGAALQATISSPVGRTTYYWQVRAINTEGITEANSSSWWAFTTR
jgi:subtilisin family serine protease